MNDNSRSTLHPCPSQPGQTQGAVHLRVGQPDPPDAPDQPGAARGRSLLQHLLLRRPAGAHAPGGPHRLQHPRLALAQAVHALPAPTRPAHRPRGPPPPGRVPAGGHLLRRRGAGQRARQAAGAGAGGHHRPGAVLVLGAQAAAVRRPALDGRHRLDRRQPPVRPLLRGQRGLPRPVRAQGCRRRARSSSPASPTSTTAPATGRTSSRCATSCCVAPPTPARR